MYGKGKTMNRYLKKLTACALTAALVVGGILAPELPADAKAVKKLEMDSTESGAYVGYHAVPDKTYLYKRAGSLHVVSVRGQKLIDYTMTKTYQIRSKEEIDLPKYDVWGGYFHSDRGQNYVAVGYSNKKEKTNKAVIKVIRYDARWNKGKTAKIQGNASNQFAGIYSPFAAGNVSFDEYQSTLYMFTSRTMFKTSDGLHHQSNIAFAIDTTKMKATTDNVSYCSHSFNQYCKFAGGNLYVVDHGDAYPRGVKVTIYDGYGKSAADAGSNAHRGSVTALSFLGNIGNNSTGATVGGLEVSSANVLIAGTAQPHNSTIDGVTGFSSAYGQNLYLIKRNRSTGSSSVRWLTNYNPKTSGQTVDRSRIVRISSNRFAVIYSVLNKTTNKRTTACVYVDGDGKSIRNETFSDVQFRGGTQPIVFNGKVVFAEKPSSMKYPQIFEIPTK